jgi:hypothetical protein
MESKKVIFVNLIDKMHQINKNLIAILLCFITVGLYAQGGNSGISRAQLLGQQRVITSAVPFLTITPDARSGGMGDVGAAISPDASSAFWNAAKTPFATQDLQIGASYTPWLRALGVNDINLSYLSAVNKIDDESAISLDLRYFTLGDITFTDITGNTIRNSRPYELATGLGYARKLAKNFSLALSGRFILSDLASGITVGTSQTRPGTAFAADIATYYQKPEVFVDDDLLSFGAVIQNIGNKMAYTSSAQRDFLPTNLKLGVAYYYPIDEYNAITFALDVNKLMIPTQPVYQFDSLGRLVYDGDGNPVILEGKNSEDIPVIQGMIQSFSDAPGGFTEELREFNPSVGVEYSYNKQVFARAGYYYEHPTKGNRQYMTFGVGLKYNILNVDFAYLVPTALGINGARSPLENTLRFSLLFNIATKN